MSVDQRIHEKDLYIPTLRIANSKDGGFIATSDLIGELEVFLIFLAKMLKYWTEEATPSSHKLLEI